jgi:ferrochelatase
MSSQHKEKIGVLLVNTGSTEAPTIKATRIYLREFLSDPRLLDMAAWKRWIILNCFILPFRPKHTAKAYEAIWTPEGSPLNVNCMILRDRLAEALESREDLPWSATVAVGMRYGKPTMAEGLEILKKEKVDRIVVLPLFPQYASATSGSVEDKLTELKGIMDLPPLAEVAPYYDFPPFLDAYSAVAKPELESFRPDHVVMSFHGLPERHIRQGDASGRYCLCSEDCCEVKSEHNRFCYRHHCITTARALAERLALGPEDYTITFQSRLGREKWLEPSTDTALSEMGAKGVRRLAVMTPSFTIDCLETLEEIGIRGEEQFLEGGGEALRLVSAPNAHPAWVEAITALLQEA